MITFTPTGGNCGCKSSNSGATSALKSISFFLLFAGIILISIGYIKEQNRQKPPRVEFRYVPRTFKEEQATKTPLLSIFGQMFSDRGPWQKNHTFVDTYPWERNLVNSRVVSPYNDPTSGLNRAVGQRIIG